MPVVGAGLDMCYHEFLNGGWENNIASSNGQIKGYFNAFKLKSVGDTEKQIFECHIGLSNTINPVKPTACPLPGTNPSASKKPIVTTKPSVTTRSTVHLPKPTVAPKTFIATRPTVGVSTAKNSTTPNQVAIQLLKEENEAGKSPMSSIKPTAFYEDVIKACDAGTGHECPLEPHCCFPEGTKAAGGCNCRGVPLLNGNRRQVSPVTMAFLNKVKDSQASSCMRANYLAEEFGYNPRDIDTDEYKCANPKGASPNFSFLDMSKGTVAEKFEGICVIFMWALKLVPFSSLCYFLNAIKLSKQSFSLIMEGKSIDVMDLVNLVKTMFESLKTVAKGGALFGDFLKEFSSFCPADVLNQENLDTVIRQIIDFIKMLFNSKRSPKKLVMLFGTKSVLLMKS